MKFSLSWLRTWIDVPGTPANFSDKLTMAGLEVESIAPVAKPVRGVVVGLVETVEPHPNADKLRICSVNVGEERRLTIVCGASNVEAGMKVPTAIVGAVLGEDFVIKPAKLRGVDSEGMLCSATELGLADSSDGLLALPDDAPLGQALVDYFDLSDVMIELSVTPNRSDCLSLMGLAREAAAIYHVPLTVQPVKALTPSITHHQTVVLNDSKACPRYACQYLEQITPTATSPLWMTERLRRSGIRAIQPLVDITQYVMLELGQPLHAFDADKLQGPLTVRFAHADETLVLLDDKTVMLEPSMLVIADNSGAIALAGVMGGLATAVTADTTRVLLESAYFTPEAIAGTARKLGLQTDAAHRFERGVDPDRVTQALTRATVMIHELWGGQVAPMQVTEVVADLPPTRLITLTLCQIEAVLGFAPDANWIETTLTSLGLQCMHYDADVWQWQVPSFRHDLHLPVDLIEEIARLYGYDALPARAAKRELATQLPNTHLQKQHAWLDYLAHQGFHEAVCYSFVSEALEQQLNPSIKPYALTNPLSPELAVMRTSLWSGLLLALKHNWHRQQSRIRLFELGSVFFWQAGKLQQPQKLAGVALGSVWPDQWGAASRPVDFYDMKAVIAPLLPLETVWQLGGHDALHPGRSASLYYPGQQTPFGTVGELHPNLAKSLDLPEGIYLFELNVADLSTAGVSAMQPFGKFPMIRRDLAFLVQKSQAVGELLTAATHFGGDFVKQVELFDVYQGERIAADKQSVAIRVTLQANDKTLTDGEVNQIIDTIITRFSEQFGAQLRD